MENKSMIHNYDTIKFLIGEQVQDEDGKYLYIPVLVELDPFVDALHFINSNQLIKADKAMKRTEKLVKGELKRYDKKLADSKCSVGIKRNMIRGK